MYIQIYKINCYRIGAAILIVEYLIYKQLNFFGQIPIHEIWGMSMMASFYCHGPLAFNMFKILAFVVLCFFPFAIVIVNKI